MDQLSDEQIAQLRRNIERMQQALGGLAQLLDSGTAVDAYDAKMAWCAVHCATHFAGEDLGIASLIETE